jgi:hypothetical protein
VLDGGKQGRTARANGKGQAEREETLLKIGKMNIFRQDLLFRI